MRILTILLAVVSCFLIIENNQICHANKFEQDFSNWVSYYYRNPEPKKVSSALMQYAQSKLFENNSSRYITATFFAAILKENAKLTKNIFSEITIKGGDHAKILFLNILWQMNSKKTNTYFKQAEDTWLTINVQQTLEWLSETPPVNLLKDPIIEPKHIDMLWAHFFATGEKQSIIRIIDILHLFRDGQDKEKAIGAAAQWSLGLQARKHRRVFHICKNQIKKTEGLTQKILTEIVLSENTEGE